MEKLLNLLNEYECYRNGYDICTGWQERNGRIVWVTDDPRPQVRSEYYILSKEFGFIKWLVENDKIDLGEKLFNLTKNDSRKSTICDLDNNDFSWEDTFLMLLSISDTPIEDLLLYLK